MNGSITPTTISDYYLKIQALTPVETDVAAKTTPLTQTAFTIPTLSVIIFLAIMIVGAFALLVTKSNQINKMLSLIVIAFVLSALHIGLKSGSSPVEYRPHASASDVPRNLTISKVTAKSFTVTWQTDSPESGAIRLSPYVDFSQLSQIFTQETDEPTQTHQLVISGLKPKTLYYFNVLSGANWYNDQGAPLKVVTSSK